MIATLKRFTTTLLLLSLANFSLIVPAYGDMIATGELAEASSQANQRQTVQNMLAREDVRAALVGYGVSPDKVQDRVNNMTNAEIQQLHGKLQDVPAGGVFGAIIAIIVIFMLLDIAGVTDIFPAL